MQSLIGKFFQRQDARSDAEPLHAYLFEKDRHDRAVAAQREEQKLLDEIVEENSGRLALEEQKRKQQEQERARDRQMRLRRHTSKTEAAMIVDGLYLGGRLCAMNYENLEQLGISAVLNITSDVKHYHEGDERLLVEYHRFAVEDSKRCDLKQFFAATSELIEAKLAAGGRVLVHCREGLSRSPSIVISYLILKRRMDLQEAVELVRQHNGMIRINEGFLRQLAQLDLEQQIAHGVEAPQMAIFDKEGRVERVEGQYDHRTAEEKLKHARKEARKKRKPRQTLHQFMKAKSEEIRLAKKLKETENTCESPARAPPPPAAAAAAAAEASEAPPVAHPVVQ